MHRVGGYQENEHLIFQMLFPRSCLRHGKKVQACFLACICFAILYLCCKILLMDILGLFGTLSRNFFLGGVELLFVKKFGS